MVTSIVYVSTIFLFSGEAEDNVFHGLVVECKKRKLPRVNSVLDLEWKTFPLRKNSTGGVVKTLRDIKLGISTVFFKQQQNKQKNAV